MKKGKIALITICALSALFLIIILISTLIKKPATRGSVSSDIAVEIPTATVASSDVEPIEESTPTENISGNAVSSNTVSENVVSENAVSENLVSENTISDNSSEVNEAETSSSPYSSNPNSPVNNYKAGDVLSSAPSNPDDYFVISSISDETFNYINGRSYQENPYISRDDLRYIKLIHYNFFLSYNYMDDNWLQKYFHRLYIYHN